MEFDQTTTYGVFVAVVVASVAALLVTDTMPTRIVLMMVAPSVLVFGALCLFLGIKHGEYRARGA
ncbi:hypothetical protein G9C85_13370 [Halorubellus sp. JP-L1]|uniref:DUF7333 family protein n=1 Tax=Halorubellus sp. JP-L1 TaxID=2715753 RepID=UPI001408F7B3|nr:hypothetical protein [Halorubellus sp. JP-L1]NHN42611.1 hypothetical protein [Halorubellus sp. JP-L1]